MLAIMIISPKSSLLFRLLVQYSEFIIKHILAFMIPGNHPLNIRVLL